MNTITATVSIKELVSEAPSRARVFEHWGISYCCDGHLSLSAACKLNGVLEADVVRDIENLGSSAAFDAPNATMSELCDHIEATHHAFLRTELPRISALAQRVASRHGDTHPEMVQVSRVFEAFRPELELHMQKEEMILFPLIRQLEAADELPQFHCGSVTAPIRVMESEHDSAENGLEQMRSLTNCFTPPSDACTTFRVLLASLTELEADMKQHVYKENAVLFPRAIAAETRLRVGAI